MSCPCSSEFANVYTAINNLSANITAVTITPSSNYNQLIDRITQQDNIQSIVYNGTGNLITGNATISGNLFSSTGFVPVCRASISFRYASATLTTLYSNNCSVSYNGVGSFTITFTNPPGNTDYTCMCWAGGPAATSITQAFTSNAMVPGIAYKTSTQCLVWISNNNSDAGLDPSNACEVNFFW